MANRLVLIHNKTSNPFTRQGKPPKEKINATFVLLSLKINKDAQFFGTAFEIKFSYHFSLPCAESFFRNCRTNICSNDNVSNNLWHKSGCNTPLMGLSCRWGSQPTPKHSEALGEPHANVSGPLGQPRIQHPPSVADSRTALQAKAGHLASSDLCPESAPNRSRAPETTLDINFGTARPVRGVTRNRDN